MYVISPFSTGFARSILKVSGFCLFIFLSVYVLHTVFTGVAFLYYLTSVCCLPCVIAKFLIVERRQSTRHFLVRQLVRQMVHSISDDNLIPFHLW